MAFNKNLDRDIEPEPDILHHTKHPPAAAALTHEGAGPGLHKVYSLDQLNQVSFEVGLEMDSNLHREIFIELVLSFLHYLLIAQRSLACMISHAVDVDIVYYTYNI